MKKILSFNEIDRTMVPAAGGKGANLGEMTRAGFPVPEGFCLTTEVYTDFVEGLDLSGKEPAQIRALLESRTLPEDAFRELQQALVDFPADTLFSVRSSATAEDLAFASFAGQQDTYLNVPAADVPGAAVRCFASLFTDRAVSYRRQNGIQEPTMSVVVQKMIRSEVSGVLFTADPLSGNRTRMVVDAVFGLGEGIVSGLVSPDHFIIDRKKRVVTERAIARKETAILPLAGGGTEQKKLDSEEPTLTDAQLTELLKLGERLEDHYSCPQDAEWAVEGGRIFLLQTRAITSLYPVPEFEDDRFHFMFNMGYQQMNTNALPNLSLDIFRGAANIRQDPFDDYHPSFVRTVGQHIFADMSQICAIPPARSLFVHKIIPALDPLAVSAFEELLQRKEKLKKPGREVFGIYKNFPGGFRRYLSAKDPENKARELEDLFDGKMSRYEEAVATTAPDREGIRTLFQGLEMLSVFSKDFVPCVITGVLSMRKLEKTEAELGIDGTYTSAIRQSSRGNKITEMNLLLGDLADDAAADPELLGSLKAGGPDLHEKLMAKQDAFGLHYRQFIREYGFRCAGELDISLPRWREDPSPLYAQIATLAKDKAPGSHRLEYREKQAQADRAAAEMVREIARQKGQRLAKKADLLIRRFRSYNSLREHIKYFLMHNFGVAREKLKEIGGLLVSRGQIDDLSDIWHLHLTEIASALESGEPLQQKVSEYRQEYERISRLTPPRVLTSEGEVLMGGISKEGLPEGALAGSGVSAGCVEGIAKVILDPQGATLQAGEILVAPFTDPGWTPLFVHAAALVTEIGGMLTHGSVVAREYGIPGVVGVTDATKILHTGQRIRVDGNRGYVLVLEDE